MDDLCWNCSSATHHRRDCPHPPNPDLKRLIQQSFKKGLGRNSAEQRSITQLRKAIEKKLVVSEPAYLPASFVKKEVNRLAQVLKDIQDEIEKCGLPVGADCLSSKIKLVEDLQTKLKPELENIRLMDGMRIMYGLDQRHEPLSEHSILREKIDSLTLTQRRLSDTIFVHLNHLRTAKRVILEIMNLEETLLNFIQQGLDAFSGRPLQGTTRDLSRKVNKVQEEWKERKLMMTKMEETAAKYRYLFYEEDYNGILACISNVNLQWKELKAHKLDFEKDVPKFTCKVCFVNEVEAINAECGHSFCLQCINALTTCAICRTRIKKIIKVYF